MPPLDEWETFPFEGVTGLRALQPPAEDEKQRHGEGGVDCHACGKTADDLIWEDEHWQLTAIGPTGLPLVLILEPKEHYDIETLPAERAAEMGPLMQRIERAMRTAGDIGRVHIGRWGEGSEHLHWWFMGRPARMRQLSDSFAAIWDDILPPVPEDIWQARTSRSSGGSFPASALASRPVETVAGQEPSLLPVQIRHEEPLPTLLPALDIVEDKQVRTVRGEGLDRLPRNAPSLVRRDVVDPAAATVDAAEVERDLPPARGPHGTHNTPRRDGHDRVLVRPVRPHEPQVAGVLSSRALDVRDPPPIRRHGRPLVRPAFPGEGES